jgi:hypothetical protein
VIAEAAVVRHAAAAEAIGSAVTGHLARLQRLVLAAVLRVHEGLVVLVLLWLLLVAMNVVDDVLRLLLLQWVPPRA